MSRTLLISTAFLVPVITSLLLAWQGEVSSLGALALISEPAWFLAGVYLLLLALSQRRWSVSVALTSGVLLAGWLLRRPTAPAHVREDAPAWIAEMTRCASVAPSVSPLRILTWTVDDDPGAAEGLLDRHPDLIVLRGVDDPQPGEALATGLDGEAIFVPGEGDASGLSVIANGSFQFCGGEQDRWVLPLPSAPGHQARAVLSFPMIRGGGVVPLEVVQLDHAGSPEDWADWPQRLIDGAGTVAASALALDSPHLVIIGDFGVPRTFRRVDAELSAADLSQVPCAASWPARLGPVPTPTLQARDRVWVGRNWRANGSRRLRTGHGVRAPIEVDLRPDAGR